MLKYKQGDLLEAFENSEVNVIAHQCNCTVGMGAGIAKKIAEKYPIVDMLDKGYRKNEIGTALYIELGNDQHIFNLYAQYYPGQPTNKKFINNKPFIFNTFDEYIIDNFTQRLEWLKMSLKSFSSYLQSQDKIGLCLLSSGLAADKKLKSSMTDLEYFKTYIASIVEEELKDFDVTVYYL